MESTCAQRRRALPEKEIRKLFKAAARDTSTAGRRDAALLAVCYGAGLRRAEASTLDAADYQDGTIRVLGKGNKKTGERWTPKTGPPAKLQKCSAPNREEHA